MTWPVDLGRRALVEGREAQDRLLADVHLVDVDGLDLGARRSAARPSAPRTSPARRRGSRRAACRRSSRRRCPTTGARRSSRAIWSFSERRFSRSSISRNSSSRSSAIASSRTFEVSRTSSISISAILPRFSASEASTWPAVPCSRASSRCGVSSRVIWVRPWSISVCWAAISCRSGARPATAVEPRSASRPSFCLAIWVCCSSSCASSSPCSLRRASNCCCCARISVGDARARSRRARRARGRR